MIHKNWAELIKPAQLEVKQTNDPTRQGTVIAEPLERGFGLTIGNALRRVLMSRGEIKSKVKLNVTGASKAAIDAVAKAGGSLTIASSSE